MRVPGFIRAGLLAGILAGTSAGAVYISNLAFHDDQVYYLPEGVLKYTRVDGIYAHTILTRGDKTHGKDSVVLERKTYLETRKYIGNKGCSSVDTIIIEPTFLNHQPRLEYKRGEYNGLKEEFFKKADAELEKQCRELMNVTYHNAVPAE